MDCRKCGVELTPKTWLLSCQKKNSYICAQCVREDNSQRYQKRKAKYLAANKLARHLIKTQIFEYYGGQCQICGENDLNKLSLDHLDGNGRQHRKEILKTDSGTQFYNWVLKNKPDNLRILCFNCNCQVDMIKKELPRPIYEIGCKYCGSANLRPHNRVCRKCYQITHRNKYIDLKIEVFEHYGNHCVNCVEDKIPFLTMDHINNDGAGHRKEIGTQIFPWLKKNNYPAGFQILCFNCNYVKRQNH